MNNKSLLTFWGGVGATTGANFLVESQGVRFLIDCGLQQGERVFERENWKDFPYDPFKIDIVFITHAHLDHIGRLPKLVKEGFRGVIYSTPETKEIAFHILDDAQGILAKESAKEGLPLLYEPKDIEKTMALWKTHKYHEQFGFVGGYTAEFFDAGHILGSSMIKISRKGRSILFTGDLGNSPTPLLNDTEKVGVANYILMESVYGDRIHENKDERRSRLKEVVNESLNKGGVLLVPAFSLEKTQVLIHELDELFEKAEIRKVPVYLDSPLAIRITEVYKRHIENLNKKMQNEIKSGNDIFNFPTLHETFTTEESATIRKMPNPKIIIAGSGMSSGGRIQKHEKEYLPDPNTTLLLVGYQAVGSLGRALAEGIKWVNIQGERVPVRAKIKTISGYSSHKDSEGLLDFISSAEDTEKVFVAMGEPKSSLFLSQRIRDEFEIKTSVPSYGQKETLLL